MNSPQKPPWYLRRVTVLLLVAFLGPLGLPFLHASPMFSRRIRLLITLVVVALLILILLQPRPELLLPEPLPTAKTVNQPG